MEGIYGYLKGIAERLLAIGHSDGGPMRFCTMEEALDGIRARLDASALLMVADAERGTIDGLGQGGLVESHRCAAALVRACPPGDYAATARAYADSMEAGRQMLARMAMDKKAMHPIMSGLVLEGIAFRRIGPFMDNMHGYEFSFSLAGRNACEYQVKAELWA